MLRCHKHRIPLYRLSNSTLSSAQYSSLKYGYNHVIVSPLHSNTVLLKYNHVVSPRSAPSAECQSRPAQDCLVLHYNGGTSGTGSRMARVPGYWVIHGEYLDEHAVSSLKSMAANVVLDDNNYKDARLYLGIATKLDGCKLDGCIAMGSVMDFCDAMEEEETPSLEPQVKRYLEATAKIHHNKGLLEYLANEIPCHCLDTTLQTHTRVEPVCDYCQQQSSLSNNANAQLDQTFLQCSRCHAASYCSKECQKADWKERKQSCPKIVDAKQRLAAF